MVNNTSRKHKVANFHRRTNKISTYPTTYNNSTHGMLWNGRSSRLQKYYWIIGSSSRLQNYYWIIGRSHRLPKYYWIGRSSKLQNYYWIIGRSSRLQNCYWIIGRSSRQGLHACNLPIFGRSSRQGSHASNLPIIGRSSRSRITCLQFANHRPKQQVGIQILIRKESLGICDGVFGHYKNDTHIWDILINRCHYKWEECEIDTIWHNIWDALWPPHPILAGSNNSSEHTLISLYTLITFTKSFFTFK